MNARRQLLKNLDELILRQHDDSKRTTDALAILREQVDDGSLTMEELKDTIVEMLFSAYHGEFRLLAECWMTIIREPNHQSSWE